MTDTRESLVRQLLNEAMAIKAWQETFASKPLPNERYGTTNPAKALKAIGNEMTRLWAND